MEFLNQLFELVLFPLMGIGTVYLIALISNKIKQIKQNTDNDLLDKYLSMLENTITDCVIATTQTYVDSLKKEGSFNIEAQKVAFAMTYEAVVRLLTDEATEYLNAAVGDLNLYITQKIEAEVNLNKIIVAE